MLDPAKRRHMGGKSRVTMPKVASWKTIIMLRGSKFVHMGGKGVLRCLTSCYRVDSHVTRVQIRIMVDESRARREESRVRSDQTSSYEGQSRITKAKLALWKTIVMLRGKEVVLWWSTQEFCSFLGS